MTNQILKPIVAGLLIGVGLYFLPIYFFGKGLFILLLIFLFFKFRRHRRGFGWSYADKIRSMNDLEYQEFKTNYGRRCGYSNETANITNESKS
ncbi:MAG: hypothetical protein ACJA08_002875 [Cyclobacteriaceae bacterium]|jgi:hypothetical protein